MTIVMAARIGDVVAQNSANVSDDGLLSWLFPVLLALIGGLIGWLLKAWEVKWARKERVAQRGEEAAAQMIPIIDDLRGRFEPFWGTYDGPPQPELKEGFTQIRRLSLDISPEEARQKLRNVASAFYYYHEACPYGPEKDWLPNQVAHRAAEAGHAIVGAIRRDEKLPQTPGLDEIIQRIEEFERHLGEQAQRPDPSD